MPWLIFFSWHLFNSLFIGISVYADWTCASILTESGWMPVCRTKRREEKSPKARCFLFPHTNAYNVERKGKKRPNRPPIFIILPSKSDKWGETECEMWEMRSGEKVDWVTCMTVHRCSSPRRWRYSSAAQASCRFTENVATGWQLSKALNHGHGHWWEFCPQIKTPRYAGLIVDWNAKMKMCVWCGWLGPSFWDTKNMQT